MPDQVSPIRNTGTLQRRREIRQRFEQADNTIELWDRSARGERSEKVPPIEATPEDLAVSGTAEITVNVEWLAYMLAYAQDTGETLAERRAQLLGGA